ncbi:MAG TPA: serine/threonine-protein kinase, partial [Polyangiaceae bacterium]|nr:serine/threonine-protein kinase [Polyangiaceae bacterium]
MNTHGVLQGALDERFVIEHSVGEGASGIVYKAIDLVDQQAVALKLFHHRDENEELLALDERPSLALAQSEYQVLRHINHPGVVGAVDVGWLDDGHSAFLATKWIEGLELHRHHQVTPLSTREIIGLALLLCRALSAIHDCGVVHQDIKPANILLRVRTPGGDILPQLVVEPVIIDFGIAALSRRNRPRGTPAYMSPEQARGSENLDHRSDLYSLGATLFELLVGRPPHQGANPLATLARLATTPAPRVSSFRADISQRVDELIDRLLQTDPARRPSTALHVVELLHKCLDETPESNRPTEVSGRLGVGATRLVTTVVAMNLSAATMKSAQDEVSARGAEVVQLGDRALVAHLGVEHATGAEANAALNLAQLLAATGASVGIASGRARLGEAYGGGVRPVGEVVDRAANLAREATMGQILSDATTTELGRGAFEFKMRTDGSAIVGDRLDGFSQQRGGAPFVGRDAELAQVLSAYERAETDHHPMIVSLSG